LRGAADNYLCVNNILSTMQTKTLLCCRAALLIVLFFSPIILFSSCSDQKPDPGNVMVKDGLICAIHSGEPYTGKVHDLINSRILEYDVVKGIKEGNFNVYSQKSGKVLISGLIKKNKNEGLWQYFYPDGQLESQGYFKDDKTSDKWYWYYPDGKLKGTGFYLEGKKDGKWTDYDKYGNVISEEVYRNNVKVAGMEETLS
jgi:antitoxin component YwqK of YwqJK toxin-antitoxin module